MVLKYPGAKTLAILLATAAIVTAGFGVTAADAQTRNRTIANDPTYDGPPRKAVNSSYQRGRTRVYVTRRSWLDAGTEVRPGERKFTDYAFPPAVGYPSFARENLNRPIDRQPLSPPQDVGGYPQNFPLY